VDQGTQKGEGGGRRRAALLALLLGALALTAGVVVARRSDPRPSLLLVSIDTLRADHVGAYGAVDAATPTLDALADSGVLFERAFAPVPLTLPSHATLHTGLEPPRHGVRHNGIHRLEGVETLAERLAAAGYRTGAFVGSFVLAAETGLARGFQRYDDTMSRQAFSAGVFLERSAEEVTDAALAWLDESDGPRFAWVHYYDPHLEHRAPAAYAERFPDRPYDAEIAYTDAQLGRLVEAFRRRSGAGGAFVLVTADHGESFGAHGERTHGYTLHDGVLRVPLIVSGPGLPPGRRQAGLAGLVDVAPTVLALLGAGSADGLDGRDLAPAWRGSQDGGPRALYAETLATQLDHGWAPLHGARSDGWRYVRAPRPELYATRRGAHGEDNLLVGAGAEEPERRSVREDHERAIDAVLAGEVASRRQAVDAATRSALEALGYAVPEAPVAESGLDPKDGMIFLRRYGDALRAFEAGRHAQARALLEGIVAGSPGSADAHSMLSRVLLLQGEPASARRHAQRASELVPASARFRALLGMLELQAGAEQAAAARFAEAEALGGSLAELEVGLLWREARAGRLDQARAHEERAALLGAGRWEIQQWVGTVWLSAGRQHEAAEAFARAAALAPEEPQPQADLALLWIRRGDEDRAREALARAGGMTRSPAFRNRLAIAHASAGQPERAVAVYEELLRERPDYAPARNNLASLRRALASRAAQP